MLIVVALCLPQRTRGGDADLEAGRPFLQNFGLHDYHAHMENWCAAQDARGVLYFGNMGVVLEYDGVSWRKLPVPGTTFVRGLAFDPASGSVFVGAADELGYLRLDADGGRTFVSLLDQLPAPSRDFRDIRRVHLTAAGEIVFVAKSQVMIWQGGKFSVWQPGNKATLQSFLVDGRVFLQSRDLGLLRLENGKFIPASAPDADFLRTNETVFLLPGAHPGELLAGTGAGTLWTVAADGRAAPFRTGADGFFQVHGLRRGQKLPDGGLALATGDAGLVWLGADGRFLGRLDQAGGLPRDQILDLFLDREGGLWVGLSAGLSRVELSEAVTVFDEHTGLPRTTINDVARIDGTLFLASDNGLYRLIPATPGLTALPAHWERVAGEELWSLCPDGTGGVLAASIDKIYQWHPDGHTETLLGPGVQPRVLRPSRHDPARVWIGLRDGLCSLRRDARGWHDEGMVPGLAEEVRTVVETADGAVWIGTPTRGVFRLAFAENPDGSRGTVAVRRYFKANGLPEKMGWTRVLPCRGGTDVIFATQAGLYRHDPATDRFVPAADYGERFSDGTFMVGNFTEDGAGDAWVSGRSPQGVWLDQELGRAGRGVPWEPLPSRIADQLGEVMGIVPEVGRDRADAVWVYGTEGVARVLVSSTRRDVGSVAAPVFGTNLRRLFTTNGPVEPLLPGGGQELPSTRNSVRFEFAADTFRYGADVRYQTRLDGLASAVWSELSPRTDVNYTNLPAGSYTFHVRGRDRDGRLGREVDYAFSVLPPWSRTVWARCGYAALAALAVAGLVRWRLGRVRRENVRLEAHVARQTGELVHARDAAESANRAKSAFLANMSHELRTPLNAVLGYAQIMLKDSEMTPRNRERLGVVARSGEHLLAMINEVLDLSKIEAGKFALDPADFPLTRPLEAAAEAFRPRAAEKRIGFVIQCAPDLPALVHGDEGRLRQVLLNLLGNAVKFTTHGRVEFRVERTPDEDGGRIFFEVRDTGLGIAADALEDVFLAFQQARGSDATQGTGLGLAIARRLVALLGGELRVESTLGIGSRFWFELPLSEVAADSPVRLPASVSSAPGHAPITGYQGARRRLLVVDDEATNRHVLRELLAPLGFSLEEFSSGDECLARCARAPRPDAVLLDLRMAGMDGFQVARALRQQPANASLKIIAVSASVFEADRQEALDAGCDDFLPKPFTEDALLSALGDALALSWVATEFAAAHANGEAVVPPAAELDALLELSRRGDVLKIRRRLADLLAADPRHAGFVEPLAALAASYQMNRLRDTLLEKIKGEELRRW